jgi:hypothetical protein
VSKVRWGRAALEGTLQPKIRWGRAAMEGTAAVVVLPFPAQPQRDPDVVVPLTAVLADGSTADSYVWRRVVSSLPAVINGTGASVTVTLPSTMSGGTVQIGVTATKDGIVSVERLVNLPVYPQNVWGRAHPATAWKGAPVYV